MNGAEVKSQTGGARFAIKPDNSGKPAEADDSAQIEIMLLGFAFWSFWAGAIGLAVWLVAGIFAAWIPALFLCSAFPALYGGILLWHMGEYKKVLLYATGCRRKADEKVAQVKREGEESIAAIKRGHESELATMRDEMTIRDNKTKAQCRQLEDVAEEQRWQWESEKGQMESENEKLTFDLHSAKATLEYYAGNARLEVYSGKDALRECGGIYVIKNTGDGKVKVGITDDNFKRRFGEIQSQCASAGIKKENVIPEILVPLDEGLREVEQAIHRALGKSRTAGEWFGITPEKAVAIVLAHVHEKRVSNFKARTKLPIGEIGEDDDSA